MADIHFITDHKDYFYYGDKPELLPNNDVYEVDEGTATPTLGIIPNFTVPLEMVCNEWEVVSWDAEHQELKIKLTDQSVMAV